MRNQSQESQSEFKQKCQTRFLQYTTLQTDNIIVEGEGGAALKNLTPGSSAAANIKPRI